MANAICQSNKDIPVDMTLGNLLFYSLSDMKISEKELIDLFSQNQIPTNYIRKISTPDAFRRASSSIKNRTMYITDPNNISTTLKIKIEVDEVLSDPDEIIRIIGRKVIDEDNQEVSYEQIAELHFYRSQNTVGYSLKNTDTVNTTIYTDLCIEVQDKFDEWSVYHTKDTIRNIVLRIVNDTHPVSLTPTGLCKFVPRTHTDLLYSLKKVLGNMNSYCQNTGDQNFMEIIPVINTEEQQGLVKDASERELKEELFSFTQELKEVLQTRQTLPPRTVSSYLEKFKILSDKVSDYENLLGNYLDFLKMQIKDSVTLVKDNSDNEDGEEEPVYV